MHHLHPHLRVGVMIPVGRRTAPGGPGQHTGNRQLWLRQSGIGWVTVMERYEVGYAAPSYDVYVTNTDGGWDAVLSTAGYPHALAHAEWIVSGR